MADRHFILIVQRSSYPQMGALYLTNALLPHGIVTHVLPSDASTGHTTWTYVTGDDIATTPAVANGIVYVASRDSNLYALGATVYEMITGRPPFDGETPAVVMMKHLNETVPSPHDIDHAISMGFCHVLEKMMAKDPAERYQTPAEMLEDLECMKENKPPTSGSVPPGPWPSSF